MIAASFAFSLSSVSTSLASIVFSTAASRVTEQLTSCSVPSSLKDAVISHLPIFVLSRRSV